MISYVKRSLECAFFPLLEVAHEAVPIAALTCLKHLLVVSWRGGFEKEHLHEGARRLTEVQTCLYDLGVVEYH